MITTRMKEPVIVRGLPTEETLQFIEEYDCRTKANREWMFWFICAAWDVRNGNVNHNPDGRLRLDTGGYVGNELILLSMRANIELWAICHTGSAPGGRWYFVPGREG